jgi:hypothetical protein
MNKPIRAHLIGCDSASSPRSLPQLGGEGKGEGESPNVKELIAFVLVRRFMPAKEVSQGPFKFQKKQPLAKIKY